MEAISDTSEDSNDPNALQRRVGQIILKDRIPEDSLRELANHCGKAGNLPEIITMIREFVEELIEKDPHDDVKNMDSQELEDVRELVCDGVMILVSDYMEEQSSKLEFPENNGTMVPMNVKDIDGDPVAQIANIGDGRYGVTLWQPPIWNETFESFEEAKEGLQKEFSSRFQD